MMARIIEEAEASIRELPPGVSRAIEGAETVAELVCHARANCT